MKHMGKTVRSVGRVMNGDYEGKGIFFIDSLHYYDKSIYPEYSNCYIIVSNDESGKIIVKSLFPTKFTILDVISNDTIDRHELVSKALLMSDVALYFKNGKKCLVRINNSDYDRIKRITYRL